MVLYVNACVREESRTKRLAEHLLGKLGEPVEEVKLSEISFPVADEAFLFKRDLLMKVGDYDDPLFSLARQFAGAEKIVIAAPYWDLSFPASLKQYIEQINVLGVTFEYSPEGIPKGLCKADRLYYVMTAGGSFAPEEFGYGYLKALAENYYGIGKTKLISAVGLDLYGADTKGIMEEALAGIEQG